MVGRVVLGHQHPKDEVGGGALDGGWLTFGSEGGGWSIIDVGDFNGDGYSEPLWRNADTLQIKAWFLNGGSICFGSEGGGWSLVVR